MCYAVTDCDGVCVEKKKITKLKHAMSFSGSGDRKHFEGAVKGNRDEVL